LSQLGGALVCFIDGADILAKEERDALGGVLIMFASLVDETAATGGIFGFKATFSLHNRPLMVSCRRMMF
jgi:hypothetical protein